MLDLWYKNAVIYCLDVDTFQDGNGDGIGDFAGLTDRLDYLAGIGVTCVWLLPFYPTPDRDNGYDITDFYNVAPSLGTLGDFVDFTHQAEDRGIRVIVDLVVNHTSIEHPWFQAARRDPELEVPRLLRLVEGEAEGRPQGHGLPRRPEDDLDLRQGGEGVLLPPLLRASAGPEHRQSGRARGDPEDHGLLAPARRLRLPDGRRAVRHRAEGHRGRQGRRSVLLP